MKRILITRPRSQADGFAEKLRVAGYETIFFPVIEIQPIVRSITNSDKAALGGPRPYRRHRQRPGGR